MWLLFVMAPTAAALTTSRFPTMTCAVVSAGMGFITLIIALFAVLPTWPHSAEWGYAPTALVAMLLLMAAFFLELAGV